MSWSAGKQIFQDANFISRWNIFSRLNQRIIPTNFPFPGRGVGLMLTRMDHCESCAWLITRQVSSIVAGILLGSISVLRTSDKAPVGHVDTHNPQPMQRSVLRTTRPFSSVSACIWHRSMQIKQPVQRSGSSRAVKAFETLSDGIGWFLISPKIPQQQPQQQQMKLASSELLGWSTKLALSARARIS